MNVRWKPGLPAIAAGLMLMSLAPGAQADIWKCVDAEGSVSYTNTQPATRGCKVLSRDVAVSTFSTPARAARPAASSSPADFPRVDRETQRGRDMTRRQILERELADEQRQLEKAQAVLSGQAGALAPRSPGQLQPYQDQVSEHQRNIDALRQELAKLK